MLLALLAGGFIGLAQVLVPQILDQSRGQGENAGLEEVLGALGDIKNEILRFVPGLPRRRQAL